MLLYFLSPYRLCVGGIIINIILESLNVSKYYLGQLLTLVLNYRQSNSQKFVAQDLSSQEYQEATFVFRLDIFWKKSDVYSEALKVLSTKELIKFWNESLIIDEIE